MISVQASLREILRKPGITVEGTSSDRGTVLRSESDPGEKAVNLMGMEVGGLRMPLTELSEANTVQLKKAMQEFGIQLA